MRTQRVLSYGQTRLWALNQIEGANSAYNMPAALKLTGTLHIQALEQALIDVIDRHEPLRTTIQNVDGYPLGFVKVVDAETRLLDQQDLSSLTATLRNITLDQLIKDEVLVPFDLSQDLMLRACLIKLTDNEHVLTLVMHHIAGDGVSMSVFCRDLAQAYVARTQQQKPDWAPLEVSYADYADWQRSWLSESGELVTQSQSWQTQLAGIPELLSLPTDYPREAKRSRIAGHLPIEISAQITSQLQRLANQHQTTIFTVLVAILGLLLGRLSNQRDVIIGAPVAGRTMPEVDNLVGFFINTLALRVDASGHPDLNSLIERVKGNVNHALGHQDIPFDRLVEDLGVTRSLSYTPVFQVMLAWQTQDASDLSLDQLVIEPLAVRLDQTKFDLIVSLVPATDGAIRGMVEYDASLFSAQRVTQWITWLVRTMEQAQALSLSAVPADTLSLLTPAEREQVVALFNHTQTTTETLNAERQSDALTIDTTGAPTSLPELFEQQVARTPEATALVFSEDSLTYAELDARANQLARHLIGLGIGPEQIVALALPRSIEMIVALLAVLKSGAAYLPLDPDYPTARLALMLGDSGARLLITQIGVIEEALDVFRTSGTTLSVLELNNSNTQATLAKLDQARVTQAERVSRLTPQNLAYLIYTSGSTGTPKGVKVTHGSMGHLVCWMASQYWPKKSEVRMLARTSISFDASVWEIFSPLISGAAVVMADGSQIKDEVLLADCIAKGLVTDIQTPPSVLPLFNSSDLKGVRFYLGGEPVTHTHASILEAAGVTRIVNLYGPTETTVQVVTGVLDSETLKDAVFSIGTPIASTQIYILDASLNPLPVGVAGELYVAGTGLARGYLSRAGLTAERFIANPFTSSARMYRSGDLARWTEDGVLEYLGRADAQVKIRGFRIELGEIEAVLVAIPGIAQCAVQARGEDGAQQLVAYLVASADTGIDPAATIPETSTLRALLFTTLPDYMVPAAFVVLESLPLTPNGKLDTRALPAPEITGEGEYRAPVTEHEQLVASLFAELTGATRVGLDDSFFALGGHSLLAMRLISQIRTRTGLELALRTLFEQPTVTVLAQALEAVQAEVLALAASGEVSVSRPPIISSQGVLNSEADGTQRVLSFGQVRLWTLEQIQGVSGNYNMPAALKLSGALQSQALALSLNDVIQRHEPLRTVIASVGGEPVGFVRELGPETTLLAHEDLSALQEPARETALEQIIARDSIASFDLSRDLMLRARLIKLTDSEHVLTLVIHHIAGDGVSMGVFCRELTQAYQSRTQDQVPGWTPLSVSYADHAAWQRAWLLDSGELERQSQSWQAQLAGIPERLSLPTDFSREANRSRATRNLPIEISAQTTAELQSLANKHQTTLFTVLVALYGTFLGRLANQSDVVIGSPVAGRTTAEVDGLIGFFINTLALRVDSSGHPDLNTLMERVKGSVNHALTHQDLPFERLVEDLGVTRSLSHTPVFQAMLAWQTQESVSLSLGELSLEMLPVVLAQTKFDLTLSIAPDRDGAIRGVLEYDASLFTESRVAQWATWFVRTLDQIPALSIATTPVDTLLMLDDAERHQVLALFNQTAVAAGGFTEALTEESRANESTTLPELFEQQVARTPEATALVFGETALTYAELDARANQLARHLISLGIGPEQIVALALPRSVEMVVALLAVLKSGAAYLPLDPDYPAARLTFMLEDSGARLLITQTGVVKEALDALNASGITLPVLELNNASTLTTFANLNQAPVTQAERVSPLTPQNLSYLIYTSGSTGQPKGAGNTHQGGSNFVGELITHCGYNPSARVLQFSSFAFDASFLEIMPAVASGATLYLIDDSTIRTDPKALGRFIAEQKITVTLLPPVIVPEIPIGDLVSLQTLMLGGEACSTALVKRHAGHCNMFNAYGPTEASVAVTFAGPLDPKMDAATLVPIGRPIQNTQIYILDASLNPLPSGVAGELYIAGEGLARGYLGRAGLTAERFVANPFIPSTRMYRSGDLARWTEDGVLEYLGRADAQIKIRGFRIELGEIEAALVAIPGIAQCSVQARGEDGAKQLVAYLVPAGEAAIPEISSLRSVLSTTLPDYMVPAAFVVLESLPLTPNGKLDVRALPAPEITGEGEYRAPITEHEQLVASLFAELTGATRVGLDDNFFALGGHSLLAMRLISQIRTRTELEVGLRTLFEQPTVAGLTQALEEIQAEVQAIAASGAVSISRPPIVSSQGVLNPEADGTQRVLSYGQIRLWTLEQIEGASGNYNMPAALRLSGALQSNALALALRDIINRHEPLRTVIASVRGAPVGYVRELGPETSLLAHEDLSSLQEPAREDALDQVIARDSTTPFDLSRDLMLRARLIKLTDTEHVLTLVMHHIAGDGVSMGVFCRELTQAYEARTRDQVPNWIPLSVSYADHAAWQRAWLEESGELERQSQSWQAQLAGIPERLSLPTDNPRDANRSRVARYLPIEISAQTTARLQILANKHQTTLFTVLVALYGTLLGRLANQSEVVIGSPVAGRTTPEVDGLIGFFINTLALRVDSSGHPDLNTLMERVKGSVNHALTHQDLPFERLVEDLEVARSLSHTPVFQTMLAWQTQETASLSLGDLLVDLLPVALAQTKFDLTLSIAPEPDGAIRGMLEYDASLFTESRVAQWVTWFVRTLDQTPALSVATTPVDTLSLLDDAERDQVLALFNRTAIAAEGFTEAPTEDARANESTTLPELFEQQVARTPEATALVFGEESLTYAELDARANQLARHLISLGIGPEQMVALALPRSVEMVVALLAVLKSGAAYLPLDPDYPAARLTFMLEDSGARLLITQAGVVKEAVEALNASGSTLPVLELNNASTQATLAKLDQAPVSQAERVSPLTPQNLAYQIYTSGSTGRPKGVGNTHLNVTRLLGHTNAWFSFNTKDVWTLFHSIAFDFSVWEIWGAFAYGGALVVVPDDIRRSTPDFLKLLQKQGVTVLNQTPAAFEALASHAVASNIEPDSLSLRYVIFGGAALNPVKLAEWNKRFVSPNPVLINMYGITETTVHVTYKPLIERDFETDISPIGQAIPDLSTYVLDVALNLLPVGIAGELYIAGAGLARGYLGRAGLTAERFVANPFTPGTRLYRSGDLARWTENGVLEYLGRADAQVKIRGFRIELGEIEAALVAIPGIAQCTVQARGEDGAKQLVAYLVADADGNTDIAIPETSVLKNTLSNTLPDYMVPAAFVIMESLPLTPNGKLDTRALPAPEITGEGEYRAPVTEHEQLVANLFAELTGATRIGLDDSFFALGGHSLLAMRLISQIRARTGLELALRTLFEQPSVTGLAQALETVRAEVQALAASGAVSVSRPPIIAGQGVVHHDADSSQRVLSFGQIRLWTLTQIEGISGNYNMPAALRLSGALQSQALELALLDVIQRHEPLRTVIANVDGKPVGYVHVLGPETTLLVHEDLSNLQESARKDALEKLIAYDSTAPFDLSGDLKVRARLIKLSDSEHVLTLVMHHIAGDGVSMGVFCRELTQAYQSRTRGQSPNWTPLSVSYADHAAWQRNWLEGSGELERQSLSWQAQLASIPERLSLPTDYSRDPNRSRAARYLPIEISAQTTAHLQSLANQHQTTLFTVLVALYGTLLGRLANQTDVVIGAPVAGRTTSEADGLIGFFINTLALRVDASGHPDLNTLMERVKGSVNHALTHQDLPFERLVEDLGVARSLSHTPVFQAMLAWQTQETASLSLGDLTVTMLPVALAQAKFDLTLSIAPEPDGAIRGTLEYDASLFTEARVAQWVTWFVRTLDQTPALSAVTTPVDTLSLLDDAERHQVLALFNRTEVSAEALSEDALESDSPSRSPSSTLPELFEQQVARTPEATALVFGEDSLTYAELDARANQLARHIISLGIGPEQIVALALPRSIEMVVSLLAVLKSGAAYLPLDPDYPTARLAFMLGDSGASLLITQSGVIKETLDALQPSGTTLPVLELNNASTQATLAKLDQAPVTQAERTHPLTPQNLAYLIYTSGSSGTPKGAGNTQSALINRLDWMQSKLQLTSADRVLQKTPWSFDVSVWEFLLPVFNGATLIVANPDGHKDPQYLAQFIREQGITTLHFVPSMLDAFLVSDIEYGLLPIKHLVTSGEALSGSLQHECLTKLPNTLLWNFYGPTEAAIDVTYWQCQASHGTESPPIGYPIWNTQIYILDASLSPLPAGVAGELYIAGAGLARGYLGRAGLTAERFVANPFTPGTRLYRSGDLARWTEEGVLEYLGRADAQVKIRGFRIELGEIEAALVAIPGVAQCTVQARGEDGAKQLVAYLVASAGADVDVDAGATIPEASTLRALLSATLPDYMVPAAFVVLESLPLTPNGKLDTRALPAPEFTGEGEYRAPVTKNERLIAALFAELTGATHVGLDDSFFALGGDSISAIRLVSLARARNAHLTVRTIFEYPSVQALAAAIEVRREQALILKPEAGSVSLTPFQTQFLQLSGSVTQFNQAVALVAPEGCSVEQVRSMLAQLVAHHDALRLKLIDTPSGRSLWLQDQAPALEVVTVDLSAQDADTQAASIAKLGQDLSMRLDPYAGQMLAATWVTTSPKPRARAQLLLAIHHLAVDGVSWRILFEDLEHLRTRNTLPARTHSVRDWAHALALQSTMRERELSDWCETLAGAQALGTDASIAPELNRMGDARHHVSLLSQELASSLGELARTYHAGMDEVLLTALGLALTTWQQTHYGLAPAPLLIDLESHGRQSDSVLLEDAPPLDITHTVGWFTSAYPVRLDASALDLSEALAGGDAAGLMLRATKERIAKMPDKGLGFGILRYLNQKTASVLGALPQAQILFNYLGRFEQSQTQEGWYSSTFVSSADNLDRARMHEIDVNAAFDEQGRLQVVWLHHPLQHVPTRIEDLAQRFEQALNALVRHATQAPLAQRHTPSDFALARARGLDQAMLDRWPQATEVWPLTALQQGLGFQSLALADAAHDPYRVQLRMTLKGQLDNARLERAFEALLERHSILNLALPAEMLEKGLGIQQPQGVDFALVSADESALSALILEDLHTPFDLERGPLIRARLIQTAPDVHHLILANHHAILDGWSMPIVLSDLAALYRAEALPPALAWGEHLKWLAAQDTEAAQRYWRGHLAGQESGALWLSHEASKSAQAADEHQEQTQTQDSGEYIEQLSAELSAGLERFARNHGLTLANVIQSLYVLLLARLSARDDITIGVTRSGRSAQRTGIDRAVGLYISTMPLRAQVDLSYPLIEWMRAIQTEFAQQDEHLHLGLQNVQQLVGQQTLFDSLFVFENYPIDHSVQRFAPGLDIAQVSGHDATHYGLALAAMMSPNGLVLRAIYDKTLLEDGQIRRIVGHLAQMVQTIATEPVEQLCLGELRWFAETERHQVLALFNQTAVAAGGLAEALIEDARSNEATTLPALFEQQVARTPEATALVFGEDSLTYAELDARANQLARHLIGLGIGPEQIVALALPRSVEMVVALLAVLKSGAAYLPLDPDYPAARLAFMLTDSRATLLITQTGVIEEALDALHASGTTPPVLELNNASTQATLAKLDQAPVTQAERVSPLTPQNLSYLIYTSGSTGTPKAVSIAHQNTVSFLNAFAAVNPNRATMRGALSAPLGFDVSIWDIFGRLTNGSSLVVDLPSMTDLHLFAEAISEKEISSIYLPAAIVPMLANIWKDAKLKPTLSEVLTGADVLEHKPIATIAAYSQQPVIVNGYGPTECTTCSSWIVVDNDSDLVNHRVAIGRPIQNTQIYILDASLNPLPVGVAGELYITGAGLARGYLGRSGLTAERFVANPFTPGTRMYRSGDLARWTEGGLLEYLGRIDAQVKIRGFRIELGEIEAALVAIPGIAQCTLLARGEDGAKQLVAYLVADEGVAADATISEASTLRTLLSTTLPDYMVPAAFVLLESLPLTPNGKLDVRALPAPEITGEGEYRAPVTEHEQLVARLFAELTGATRVGLDDNFFALGGHSLLAMRLISEVRARTGRELALRTLFEYSTVEEFASKLKELPIQRMYQPLLPLNKTGSLPPLFCFPPAGGIATVYKNLSDELGKEHPVWGLQARGVDDDEDQTDQTISDAARTYVKAIKEVQPQGPYYLMGMSLGGTLAHEAAVQLEEHGDTVAALFLMDTANSYPQTEYDSKSENEDMSELLINQLKDTTDQDLPPAFDDMLNLFQRKWEELGLIPVGTPKSYVLGALKNSVQSSNLTRNYSPKKCHANIVYFGATEFSSQDTPLEDLSNWQPFTDQPVRHYDVPVSHAQMLWQPVSYKLIASKVHEIMVAHKQKQTF